MGKDARIKKYRRDYRKGIVVLPKPPLPQRALRRSEVAVKTGSFSVMEVAHAFMAFHEVKNCSSQDALDWAAGHHRMGLDWRRLQRIQKPPQAEGAPS